jgi:hypothetical protein
VIPAEVPSQNSPGILVGNALSGPDKPGRRLIELFRWVPLFRILLSPRQSVFQSSWADADGVKTGDQGFKLMVSGRVHLDRIDI